MEEDRLDSTVVFFQERYYQLLRLASCDTNGEAAPPSLVPTTGCDPYPGVHPVRLLLLDHEDIRATNAPRGLSSCHFNSFLFSTDELRHRLAGVLVRVSARLGRPPRRRTRATRVPGGTRRSSRAPRAIPSTSIHHNLSRQTSSTSTSSTTSSRLWRCRPDTHGDRRPCARGWRVHMR